MPILTPFEVQIVKVVVKVRFARYWAGELRIGLARHNIA